VQNPAKLLFLPYKQQKKSAALRAATNVWVLI
jgi:hypothetical protein